MILPPGRVTRAISAYSAAWLSPKTCPYAFLLYDKPPTCCIIRLMNESYLFSLLESSAAPLAAAGVRAARVDEVAWLGPPPAPMPENIPAFIWPDGSLQSQLVLHTLLAELARDEREMVVLGQGSASLLLGGPAVVGRYNLLPLARLTPLAAQCGLNGMKAALTAALSDDQVPAWAAVMGPSEPPLEVPGLEPLAPAPNLLALLNHLLQTREKRPGGLLARGEGASYLLTLFEAL